MEDSLPSTRKGKRSTPKTESLTRGQALEILQQTFLECQKAGIEVRVIPAFYHSGQQYCAVLMANVTFFDGNFHESDGK